MLFCFWLLLPSCSTTETKHAVIGDSVGTYGLPYYGEKQALVIGEFSNRSDYLRGIFTSGDKLGGQAKALLKAHLQQTNRFSIVDRDNKERLKEEAALLGSEQDLVGARYAITGGVSEFGRKVTGNQNFFGLLGSSKTQTAYSKVTLNVVDVFTSEIVYSTQGAGEYSLTDEELLGFSSFAGYDSTLNGKVLNFSMIQAVNNLVADLQNGVWGVNP